jgi:hypothetical protein
MRRLMHGLMELWRARQRQIDLVILWPACKRIARENTEREHALIEPLADVPMVDWLTVARAMFAEHARIDSAWRYLPEAEIEHIIAELN